MNQVAPVEGPVKNYVIASAAAFAVGLLAGAYFWYTPSPSAAGSLASIVVSTPQGQLTIHKTERVRARERGAIRFLVANSTDTARSVSLGFFRKSAEVNVCSNMLSPVTVAPQDFVVIPCAVARDIVDRFPADPTIPDEAADPNVRVIDYKITFDGSTYYDPTLIIER